VKDEGWRVRKDGSRFFADVVITALKNKAGFLIGFTKITRDITQRKEMDDRLTKIQAELFQSSKLEAIGRLAGGVAHDFNNLITGILGISQDVQRTFPLDDPRRAEMEELIKASNRAFDVTRQLLAFSRLQVASPRVIDINATIRDFMKLLTRLLGEDIKLKFELSEQSHVRMDPGHLDQVLLNLALNARDAMPKGGVILIQTANIDHAQENERRVPHVLLEVADTGTGMDAKTLEHIFEPFFTTKSKDRGTGLGLATVYGIVKQNGGDIAVHSQAGNGSTFRIYLPRELHLAERAQPSREVLSPKGGHETILLIEDEDIVRRVVMRRLKSVGYTVLEASDPHHALKLCQDMGSSINLVITDVIMPGLNGREVIDRIRAIHPHVAVLYMSAYPDEIITHRGILDPGINFLEKSAIQQHLFRAVREALAKVSENRTAV
jgi:signal transduction histidine kinase/ActR/RegA family two-component response regulator